MRQFFAVLLITIIATLVFPAAVLTPQPSSSQLPENLDLIFDNVAADYALYTSLLDHTYSLEKYQILTCADTPQSAVAYLTPGFALPLAQSMVDYYLLWVPELGKMAVIPTDSIPIITTEDKPYVNIHRVSPDEVVLERIYTNCYESGDRYLYRITAHQVESHWIIAGLSLEPLANTSDR